MNRLQQSGLIALFLLLAIAGAGSFLGRGKVTENSIETSVVTLEPGSLGQEIDLYSRRERLSSTDFQRDPLPGPLSPPTPEADPVQPRIHRLEGGGGELPPGPPAAAARRKVKVRDGDNLERIAGRELGDRKLWRLVATTNGLQDPFVIRSGQELLMPTEQQLANSRAALQPREASAPVRALPPAAGERQHLVVRGETAGEISQRYYGTSKHSDHILRANGLSDPRDLRAGKTILIPPPPPSPPR
ncbi:MAG: LysM peptidoglycan-binding domain-containing protein [Planctomycetes bacterium]|nr:LysM peptidoglycan-binding domain-containing protein [Planctomycetota bacterium]